jgi:replicative DNA helicase
MSPNAPPSRGVGERSVPIDTRVPPNDVEAEAAVLSAAMSDPETLAVIGWLNPEDFYSEPNRRIFEAAVWLAVAGQTINVVSVAGRLQDTDRLKQVGGTSYLADLVDKLPSVANVEEFASRIRDKSRARRLLLECQRTIARVHCNAAPSLELLSTHEQSIFELSQDEKTRKTSSVGTIVRDVFEEIQAAAVAGKEITGIPTGFDKLDKLISGLHEDELTIIAARPGMGKTALAMDVAQNVAASGENGVMVFSLEMPRKQLGIRWLCGEARINSQKLRYPKYLSNPDWDGLSTGAVRLFQLPIEVDDTPGISLVEIAGKCRKVSSAWRGKPELKLVIVDYLQLARGDRSGNREQEISSLSRGLKELAKQLHVPVIALSQLNRGVETRGSKDKRPQLSDLRESGAIEQDADNIIFIYREEYYDPNCDKEKKGIAELIVAKQRNGPTGKAFVRFDGSVTRFDQLADHEYPREEAE